MKGRRNESRSISAQQLDNKTFAHNYSECNSMDLPEIPQAGTL